MQEVRTVSVCDINPFLRNVGINYGPHHNGLVRAYDSRLFYILEGRCQVTVNRRTVLLEPDSVLIVTPLDEYCVHPIGAPFCMAVISFDLTQESRAIAHPLLYDTVDCFQPAEITQCTLLQEAPCIRGLAVAHLMEIRSAVEQLVSDGIPVAPMAAAAASCRMKHILLTVFQAASNSGKNDKARRLAERLEEYIKSHACEPLCLAQLTATFHYHASYLNRVLQKWRHLSAHKLLCKYRMEHALDLLQNTDDSVEHIALLCGYPDAKYFSRVFAEYYHRPPSSCRK